MEKTQLKDWYLSNFKKVEESLNGESKTPFHEIRKKAISIFEELDFPTVKNEEWKYTNIAPILNYNFTPADAAKLYKNDIERFLIPGINVYLAVLINGRYS